ncbi:MAG: cupin domain-containing protein [Geminicoccaceae bacterium]
MGTIFGLELAQEASAQRGAWGTMSWLVEDRTVEGMGLSLARMSVAPGQASPAHSHPDCHEIIHLVSRTVEQTADGRRYQLSAGDTVVVGPGRVHRTRNLNDAHPAELLVCYSAGMRIYQPESEAP